MKRLVRTLFLAGVLMAALCATAWAADAAVAGIYNVKQNDGVTITPNVNADPTVTTVGGASISGGFYPGAEWLTVSVPTTNSSAQYLVLALSGTSVPTEDSIVYIDQNAGNGGNLEFKVYPRQLTSGQTYNIYITSDVDTTYNTGTLKQVGAFQYYAPYKLGDVDEDKKISAVDAMYALQMSVGTGTWTMTQRLAAEVDGMSPVTSVDAMLILQASVGLHKLQ